MQESEFHTTVDHIYFRIEEQIDEAGLDIDYETGGGVMTLTCENDGSKIVLSRQPVNREIWVAARSGGFHFQYVENRWTCATGESLADLLSRVIAEQSGEELPLVFQSSNSA